MSLVKRILQHERSQRLAGRLIGAYLRLVRATTRWTWHGREHLDALAREDGSFIFSLWHNRLAIIVPIWTCPERTSAMISSHRDGRLIWYAMEQFGFHCVTGSSRQGGAGALREMTRRVRSGGVGAITPDGPRGPRMHAQGGVIALARLTGRAILPMAASSTRRKMIGSWDRMLIPLPFGNANIVCGEPLTVPRDADETMMEALRLEVEQRMTAVADEADRLCGHPPVPPA